MYKRVTFEHLALTRNSFGRKQSHVKMNQKKENVRSKWIVIRMNNEEISKLNNLRKKTTIKSRSSYIRKVALQEPVTILYRNKSADAFLEEMIILKRELHAIGNNINQAVHKLHTLDKIPEFRTWGQTYMAVHHRLLDHTHSILANCQNIYRLWSRESPPQ